MLVGGLARGRCRGKWRSGGLYPAFAVSRTPPSQKRGNSVSSFTTKGFKRSYPCSPPCPPICYGVPVAPPTALVAAGITVTAYSISILTRGVQGGTARNPCTATATLFPPGGTQGGHEGVHFRTANHHHSLSFWKCSWVPRCSWWWCFRPRCHHHQVHSAARWFRGFASRSRP
jgi:hypothetical protein